MGDFGKEDDVWIQKGAILAILLDVGQSSQDLFDSLLTLFIGVSMVLLRPGCQRNRPSHRQRYSKILSSQESRGKNDIL